MAVRSHDLFWEGSKIGVVSNPKVDNFDYYGPWQPTEDAELYKRFLAQVELEGGARVRIGEANSTLTGTVELEPDDEIQIKIRLYE